MYCSNPHNMNVTVKYTIVALSKREELYFVRVRGTPRRIEDGMQWLPGFVDSVGVVEAEQLLEGVGVVAPKPAELGFLAMASSQNAFGDQGMAACLLVKDDNPWLSEWLAYRKYIPT
jgi:hypothetical protein